MNIEVNKEEIKEQKEYLISLFGRRNIKNTTTKEIKKAILMKRLIENIKNVKKGDIVYRYDTYKNDIENDKEYVVFSIGNKTSLFGSSDIIINNGNGYIAGGLDGCAVIKEDYKQFMGVV